MHKNTVLRFMAYNKGSGDEASATESYLACSKSKVKNVNTDF